MAIYAPLLKRWLRQYEIQQSDADDLVQDVLAAVVTDLPKFQHNQRNGAFRSWLRCILVNRVRNHWRSRKYRPIATGATNLGERLDQLECDGSEMSWIWDREHDEFVLNRLMEAARPRFDARTWQAFHRQVIDGERPDAVARELGMTLGSVYMAKSRVLAALRRESRGLIDDL